MRQTDRIEGCGHFVRVRLARANVVACYSPFRLLVRVAVECVDEFLGVGVVWCGHDDVVGWVGGVAGWCERDVNADFSFTEIHTRSQTGLLHITHVNSCEVVL